RVQAAEVERRLAGPVPEGDIPVYRDRAFDDPAAWPPGTELALDHARRGAGREVTPLPISRAHQAFQVAGVAEGFPDEVRPLALRLASMDEVYRALAATAPGLFYWQFTSLREGLHSVYPGHGGYPPTFDGRSRSWYRDAERRGALTWTTPN